MSVALLFLIFPSSIAIAQQDRVTAMEVGVTAQEAKELGILFIKQTGIPNWDKGDLEYKTDTMWKITI
ncbi:hypothetical protein CGZ75_12925 [Paenibacillus herberti]|uniref:Uncharacterized protein n=1 Tax=Paenibacillus herberti TaxID=1619309 RepID=A0A229NVN0_9BACL|nr:hypothetical protein CGZ75_12925 [Paenibacillus herberti]